jgi:hypothetical protein
MTWEVCGLPEQPAQRSRTGGLLVRAGVFSRPGRSAVRTATVSASAVREDLVCDALDPKLR